MISWENRERIQNSVQTSLRLFCLFALLFLTPLFGGRVVFNTLEGDFEQEYRIVEQSGIWRIDAITKNWSILYDSKSGRYTGLEHRDGSYWGFRWEEVQKATQGTKHHLNRLSDVNIEGFASYDLTRPTQEAPKSEAWKVSPVQRVENWLKLPSRFWDLTQSDQGSIRAQTVIQPFLQELLTRFSVIHEQIRQAVIRPLWPEKVDEALATFRTTGEVGVKFEWGSQSNPFYWKIEKYDENSSETASFFEIPKKYHPTTIESLRGILNEVEEKP